jgi:hypothetical protein
MLSGPTAGWTEVIIYVIPKKAPVEPLNAGGSCRRTSRGLASLAFSLTGMTTTCDDEVRWLGRGTSQQNHIAYTSSRCIIQQSLSREARLHLLESHKLRHPMSRTVHSN